MFSFSYSFIRNMIYNLCWAVLYVEYEYFILTKKWIIIILLTMLKYLFTHFLSITYADPACSTSQSQFQPNPAPLVFQ